MKKLNLKALMLLLAMIMLSNLNVNAQEESSSTKKEVKKKVVIIQKVKDKDGKIIVKRVEKEGKEATKYLNQLELKGKDGEIIDLDIDIPNIENITDIKDLGDHIEVIEIEDWENVSEEIQKKLEGLDIELDILDEKLEFLDGKLEGLDETFEIIELEGMSDLPQLIDLRGHDENHLMITPKEGEEQKVETIDISIDDDNYEVKIKVDGQTKKYKWEGDIPANIKQEIEALGFDVKQGKTSNITKWIDEEGQNIRIRVGKDKKARFFNSDEEVHIGFPSHDKKHLNIEPTDKIKDKVETININLDGDEHTLDIQIDGEAKSYKWKGEMPEDIKNELTEMGFKVSMSKGFPNSRSVWVSNDNIESDGVFLGVQMGEKRSDLGVYVDEVVEGSAAEVAGLQAGDIITAIDDKATPKFKDLVDALGNYKVGDKANISYIRGENTAKATATFEKNTKRRIFSIGANKMKFKSFDVDKMEFEFDNDSDKMEFFRKSNNVVLGVFPDMDTELEKGIQISGVTKEGGAEKAGLEKGDIILEIDGQSITKEQSVGQLLKDKKEGDVVKVLYERNGTKQSTSVTLSTSNTSRILIGEHLAKFPERQRKVIIIRKKDKKTTTVEEKVVETKVGNHLELEEVKVFPNPTEGQLTIEFQAEAVPTTVVVRDVSGKEIYAETMNQFGGNYKKQIDVQNAASGILVVTVQQGEKVFNIKVLKN